MGRNFQADPATLTWSVKTFPWDIICRHW